MGPVSHVGIAVPIAYLLGLNIAITAICALLPDLVDKPLWMFGIGNGRYVAHTLLFALLVTLVFSVKSKIWGASALLGGLSHLLLDSVHSWPPVPWLYPMVSYDFSAPQFGWLAILDWIAQWVALCGAAWELLFIASVMLAVYICVLLVMLIRRRFG